MPWFCSSVGSSAVTVEVTARGAGEILLNSIDRDGTKAGFDLELIRAVKAAVSIPVIASSGAGAFVEIQLLPVRHA